MAAIDFASWEALIAFLTAAIGFMAFTWAKVIKPIVHGISRLVAVCTDIEHALPVLVKIAEQFKPNGGGSLRDVIDRVETKIELLHRRQRAMLEYVAFGAFESADDGSCLWINRTLCEWMGISDDQAHGNGWVTGIHPDDRELVYKEWISSVESSRDFSLPYRFVNVVTNAVTYCHGYARKVKANERANCYFGVCNQITKEQFEAESNL